jgi:hypothetical protein
MSVVTPAGRRVIRERDGFVSRGVQGHGVCLGGEDVKIVSNKRAKA